MRTGIDPTVDYAFKRVFATEENEPLLVHFLNAVLDPPPTERIVDIESLTTVSDRRPSDDKLRMWICASATTRGGESSSRCRSL